MASFLRPAPGREKGSDFLADGGGGGRALGLLDALAKAVSGVAVESVLGDLGDEDVGEVADEVPAGEAIVLGGAFGEARADAGFLLVDPAG